MPLLQTSFTGTIPENYDTYLGPLIFEFTGRDIARRVAGVVDGPARVLEIACGTGISTRHLANALPAGSEIVATDLNEAMLEYARQVNGALPGVTYAQADALDLPYNSESFDVVVCQFGIMFFPDKAKGMSEMRRVTRTGGTVALNVWDGFADNPVVGVVDGVIKQFFSSNPPRFLEIPFGQIDVDMGRALFEAAQLTNVDVAKVSEAVDVADYAVPARGFVTGNPTILEINERAEVSAEDVVSAAILALENEFGPTPAKLPFQATVFVGQKI
ncbi:MAG: class I SAM-dependent methyltransferase [Gammaproteobacteria bacterium]|nr:class I SAM-dependent methyltransferase [Gammaproteobacteria bacterium]